MIKEYYIVEKRETGERYDAFVQAVQISPFIENFTMRWNIGINGHNEWSNICCIYDNNEFNETYKVIKYVFEE